MKKFSKVLVFVAAFGAMAFVSCRQDDGKKVSDAVFAPAANQEQAVVITFDTKDSQNRVPADNLSESADAGTKLFVQRAEFTNNGYAVIDVTRESVVRSDVPEVETFIEPYEYIDDEYVVENFGSVKISGSTVVVTLLPKGGTEDPVVVTVTPVVVAPVVASQEGSFAFNLCRSWVVDRIVVSVKGGQLGKNGVGIKKDAVGGYIDLGEIANMLEEQDVNIPDVEDLEKYNVKDINFTENGTFFINFKEAKPFYGTYTLTSNKFDYVLSADQGNSIINGEANGSIDFKSVNGTDFCYFNVNGKIESGSDVYTTTVELTLKQK